MPVLEALGTAVPEHRVAQSDLRDLAAAMFAEHAPDLARLMPVFDNSGIRERFFVEDLDWYMKPHGWKARQERFLHHAVPLAEAAATKALDRADLAPDAIDAVSFVCTTGIATPSPDARLVNAMGIRPDASRLPVWGLGCAGGVAGLARGRDLALARPDSRTLVVALEICSLAFQFGDFNKKTAVAASLFGDGAAAAIVTGDGVGAAGPRITRSTSHLFPKSERVMGWDIEDHGLDVVFSQEIPTIVEREMAGLVERLLEDDRPERWLMHPGGTKVLAAYQKALGLSVDQLQDAYAALADHGNMSSPSVLFVVERALGRAPLATDERALLAALGPGFAGELLLLEGA